MGVMNQHTYLEGTTDMGQTPVESRGEHHQNSWILWMSLVLAHHHVSAIIWQDLSLEKFKHSIIYMNGTKLAAQPKQKTIIARNCKGFAHFPGLAGSDWYNLCHIPRNLLGLQNICFFLPIHASFPESCFFSCVYTTSYYKFTCNYSKQRIHTSNMASFFLAAFQSNTFMTISKIHLYCT